MDPSLIIAGIQAGAALFKSAEGLFGPKQQAAIDTGSAIVSAATNFYGQVKDDLSAGDIATVDAAVEQAHATCGADLARVLAELDAAAQH